MGDEEHHHHLHPHLPRGEGRGGGRWRLVLALVLTAAYTVAEAVGGVVADSLALLADAGHMVSDVAALALSLFASWIATRPPNSRRSYGYYRAEILAALANGAGLLVIAVFVFIEAAGRFRHPTEVKGELMLAVAAGGLLVNLAGLRLLAHGKEESLNLRGAWLHVFMDTLGSVGTLLGGAAVWLLGWNLADPVISVLIGILIVISSWEIIRESVAVLMESSPGHIDVDAVRNALAAVPGVRDVHDLHVWTITTGWVALSAHLVLAGPEEQRRVQGEVRRILPERFGIGHITIQYDLDGPGEECCEVCDDGPARGR